MNREITFFRRFEVDILADRKTITIRDNSESDFRWGNPASMSQ